MQNEPERFERPEKTKRGQSRVNEGRVLRDGVTEGTKGHILQSLISQSGNSVLM